MDDFRNTFPYKTQIKKYSTKKPAGNTEILNNSNNYKFAE